MHFNFVSYAFAYQYAEFNVELRGDSTDFKLKVDGYVNGEFKWWILEIGDIPFEFIKVMCKDEFII